MHPAACGQEESFDPRNCAPLSRRSGAEVSSRNYVTSAAETTCLSLVTKYLSEDMGVR